MDQYIHLNHDFCVTSFAWYTQYFGIQPTDNVRLQSKNSYFAGGNGSEEAPYEIGLPIHLYNLAWLQDLGYFDEDDDAIPSTAEKDRFYFVLKNNIDMKDFHSALPPIGINAHPFVSDFNGNGYQISNLEIQTKTSEIAIKPSENLLTDFDFGHAVGMFGVIETKDDKNTEDYTEGVGNFLLDRILVKNTLSAIVGLACGYVDGNLHDVGLYRSNLTFQTGTDYFADYNAERISEYALVGKVSDTTHWSDRPGKVEDFVFDHELVWETNGGSNLGGREDFNVLHPDHTAFNREIFNLIGELKVYSKSSFSPPAGESKDANGNWVKEYTYEGKTYTYTEDFNGHATQFQDGGSAGSLRNDRQLRFHSDGKGAIFMAYTGNAAGKQISIYKAPTIQKNFTSADGTAFSLTSDELKNYTSVPLPEGSAVTTRYELKWVQLDIEEPGDYIFAVDGGNTYMTYLHFIISNDQGNTGGDVLANMSNIGWLLSESGSFDGIVKDVQFEVYFKESNMGIVKFQGSGTISSYVIYYDAESTVAVLPSNSQKSGESQIADWAS